MSEIILNRRGTECKVLDLPDVLAVTEAVTLWDSPYEDVVVTVIDGKILLEPGTDLIVADSVGITLSGFNTRDLGAALTCNKTLFIFADGELLVVISGSVVHTRDGFNVTPESEWGEDADFV